MKKFYKFTFVIITILSLVFTKIYAHLKPENISVNDYSGVFSEGVKNYIKSKNELLTSKSGAKIIFVTTEETDELQINEYCRNLYDNWNISELGRNNNIFITIDTKKSEYAFVIGKNIRLAITERDIYQFIIDKFEPDFSRKNYDQAVMKLYNEIGAWYESQYTDMDLSLDKNTKKYITGSKIKDDDPKESKLWIWITAGVFSIVCIILLKIKRNIELKYRQIQRRRLRKKFQIDVDKIVNS